MKIICSYRIVISFILALGSASAFSQKQIVPDNNAGRSSPVKYHLSFDGPEFLKDDVIQQSGRRSIAQRNILFTKGKIGEGMVMRNKGHLPDQENMTGIDLDPITGMIYNTESVESFIYNEPFLWGSGKINGRLGAISLSVKGKLPPNETLFAQATTSFGRLEKDLICIGTDAAGRLMAYVKDARYVLHSISGKCESGPETWNEIVFNWDWANGLELWCNGKRIASSWGKDGWFETAPPGLFHFPAYNVVYDELYFFDRPLTPKEVETLYHHHSPPGPEQAFYTRKQYDRQKLQKLGIASNPSKMPVVKPGQSLTFTEIWPLSVADEKIPGWDLIDGRNETAWPRPYAYFTIIPGDADHHAREAEIRLPQGDQIQTMFSSPAIFPRQISSQATEKYKMPGNYFQFQKEIILFIVPSLTQVRTVFSGYPLLNHLDLLPVF